MGSDNHNMGQCSNYTEATKNILSTWAIEYAQILSKDIFLAGRVPNFKFNSCVIQADGLSQKCR